jgi:hypothetical protein
VWEVSWERTRGWMSSCYSLWLGLQESQLSAAMFEHTTDNIQPITAIKPASILQRTPPHLTSPHLTHSLTHSLTNNNNQQQQQQACSLTFPRKFIHSAFTLGVKDSSINSPNTKLVL